MSKCKVQMGIFLPKMKKRVRNWTHGPRLKGISCQKSVGEEGLFFVGGWVTCDHLVLGSLDLLITLLVNIWNCWKHRVQNCRKESRMQDLSFPFQRPLGIMHTFHHSIHEEWYVLNWNVPRSPLSSSPHKMSSVAFVIFAFLLRRYFFIQVLDPRASWEPNPTQENYEEKKCS